MTTPDYGRDSAALSMLSESTGIHIVAATGYNKLKFSTARVAERSMDELTERFVQDIENGMDGTSIKAGLVTAASSLDIIKPDSEKLIRAAARAHLQTGAAHRGRHNGYRANCATQGIRCIHRTHSHWSHRSTA